MRPVVKWTENSQHTLDDGNEIIVQKEYKYNKKSRPVLCANLGLYCSYCENSLHEQDAMEVEHIIPVSRKQELEERWDNYLLACSPCNKHKSSKRVILKDIHLPHQNNTYKSLVYNEAGGISPNKNMTPASIRHANNLIKLLSLDNPSKNDMRRHTWEMAIDALEDYSSHRVNINLLMNLIRSRGNWSIWFTVFKDHKEVRERLIKDFPGTAEDCFDENNHYEPLDRNPGKTDPV